MASEEIYQNGHFAFDRTYDYEIGVGADQLELILADRDGAEQIQRNESPLHLTEDNQIIAVELDAGARIWDMGGNDNVLVTASMDASTPKLGLLDLKEPVEFTATDDLWL